MRVRQRQCMRRLSSASTALKNSSVARKGWSGRINIARSFVILPDSTTSTQTFSNVSANLITSGVPSMRPRNISPRVQAKIEAMGLVEVGLPCW